MRSHSAALAALALASSALAAVDPIVIKGSHFFQQNSGDQFYIKGVAYQQGVGPSGNEGSGGAPDPLADGDACSRDVKYLKQLDTNTVRVYAVDPSANHDACMNTFADNGIYVIADLSSPDVAIITTDPQWNDEIYNHYISVIDALQSYPNTLGFFAGNEVITNKTNSDAAAFVKAAVRDTKAYIKAKGYRSLGVGYAANDDPTVRNNLDQYLDCGDESESVDFYGINIYEWCTADQTFTTSGYSERVAQFKSYNVPVFFSEYGCITDPPRLFHDTPVLLGPQMDSVFSGGIVYQYFDDIDVYGLVSTSGDSVKPIQPGFGNLQKEISSANPSSTQMGSYSPTNSAAACPAIANDWAAKSSPLPPSPNSQLCSCMVDSLSCVASDSVSPSKYGSLFSYACNHGGKGTCDGINTDTKTGTYGAYSMCAPKEKLSYVFNAYAKSVGGDNACDFNGAAKSQTPSSASGQCKDLLAQAGPQGTGSVTSSPTSVASSGSATSSGAASPVLIPSLDMSVLKMGAYVAAAFLTGASMLLL